MEQAIAMANPFGAPEITVHEVAAKRERGEVFVLLDVRERAEWELARIAEGVELAPLSELATERLNALPKSAREPHAEIVVLCHHGVRSAQVTQWLLSQGWTNVRSMAGGLDEYARSVDPSIGFY